MLLNSMLIANLYKEFNLKILDFAVSIDLKKRYNDYQ